MSATPAWYCVRTKPKHEHIAAGSFRKNLGLEVFNPQLRLERATRRGVVRVVESLFPCYVFARCVLADQYQRIRHTVGVSSLVQFGDKFPVVSDSVIQELRDCFEAEDPLEVEDRLWPGVEVVMADGAFVGMHTLVLRVLPSERRVQVLLDILGRPTPVEVDRRAVVRVRDSAADRIPELAAPGRSGLRVVTAVAA